MGFVTLNAKSAVKGGEMDGSDLPRRMTLQRAL